MACLRGSVPCLTTMVVLHDGRGSYICILLVISFLIKLTCVVLRNWLSNVARESRKCQAFAHFLHSSGVHRWVGQQGGPISRLLIVRRIRGRRHSLIQRRCGDSVVIVVHLRAFTVTILPGRKSPIHWKSVNWLISSRRLIHSFLLATGISNP